MKQQLRERSTLGKFKDQFLCIKYGSSLHQNVHCSLSCSNGLFNVHPPSFGGFPSFYIPFPSIPALHLYVKGHFLGYLSYQDSAEGGRKGCQLWSYCSGVISTLMQLIRLVQGFECGGGKYILQETSSHHPCPHYCPFSPPQAFIGYQL